MSFIVQALIINFPTVLFLSFSTTYGIPISQITFLSIVNFACQFAIDALSAVFASKLSYRAMAVSANFLCAAGLVCLGILPNLLGNAYLGLVIATLISAIGGGLIEIIGNPIMHSCPKEKDFESMGFLHSFYCWGHLFVVLASTLFLLAFGSESWMILSLIWAAVPLFNAICFLFVPINQPSAELESSSSLRKMLKTKAFWIFVLLMLLGGACEQGMAQWASAFAELALTDVIPEYAKLIGDLMGPCIFALTMAISRLVYAKLCSRLDLKKMMIASTALCAVCYIVAALSRSPFLSLIGCGICGFSVGIMWPGTIDLASMTCPFIGTALFATLSLAGDLGCMMGPSVVGFGSDIFGYGELGVGLMFAAIIPIAMIAVLLVSGDRKNKSRTKR